MCTHYVLSLNFNFNFNVKNTMYKNINMIYEYFHEVLIKLEISRLPNSYFLI